MSPFTLDLIILTADHNQKAAIQGLLGHRTASLCIKQITFDVRTHPRRDPGCLREAPQVLQPYAGQSAHALVIFDHEGCGKEAARPEELEADCEKRLEQAGWGDRASAIVLAPELESWVWSRSSHVPRILGWLGSNSEMVNLLQKQGYWRKGDSKPHRPKEAMEAILRRSRIPRSSAIFEELAKSVGLTDCEDTSFRKLRAVLRKWFATDPR